MAIQTNFEKIIERLKQDGRVTQLNETDTKALLLGVEAELEDFRIEGRKRQQDSLAEMSSLVLTA
jgi:rRNA maturation endonuclease Nob1